VPIVSVAPKHRVRVWEFWGDSLPPAIEVVRGGGVTPTFMAKIDCMPLCVSGSSFTDKATDNEINTITSVYYIESYYKAYYKTKRIKQRNIVNRACFSKTYSQLHQSLN
jgi:hypothetical protein